MESANAYYENIVLHGRSYDGADRTSNRPRLAPHWTDMKQHTQHSHCDQSRCDGFRHPVDPYDTHNKPVQRSRSPGYPHSLRIRIRKKQKNKIHHQKRVGHGANHPRYKEGPALTCPPAFFIFIPVFLIKMAFHPLIRIVGCDSDQDPGHKADHQASQISVGQKWGEHKRGQARGPQGCVQKTAQPKHETQKGPVFWPQHDGPDDDGHLEYGHIDDSQRDKSQKRNGSHDDDYCCKNPSQYHLCRFSFDVHFFLFSALPVLFRSTPQRRYVPLERCRSALLFEDTTRSQILYEHRKALSTIFPPRLPFSPLHFIMRWNHTLRRPQNRGSLC